MQRTLLGLPLVLALIVAFTGQAAEPTPTAEELIARLGHDDFTERDRAFQALQERGPAVLPALRKASAHRDPEVRRQVEQLIALLEAAAALAPQRVSLQGGGRSLAEVLKDVEKQTGYKVEVDEKAGVQPLNLELKQATFWEALERLGRDTRGRVTVPFFKTNLHLVFDKGPGRFAMLDGSFRLELKAIHEDRDRDFSEPDNDPKATGRHDHKLTLTFLIMTEPRLFVRKIEPVGTVSALDENDKSLVVLEYAKPKNVFVFDEELIVNHAGIAKLVLQRTSDKATRIRNLKGTIPIQVFVDRKPIIVSQEVLKSAGTKCRIGPDEVEVRSVDLERRGWYIRLGVPESPEGQHDYWGKRVHVEDAEGNRYYQSGSGHSQSGREHTELFIFREPDTKKVGPPARLIVEEWTSLTYPVRFHFKDVPLP